MSCCYSAFMRMCARELNAHSKYFGMNQALLQLKRKFYHCLSEDIQVVFINASKVHSLAKIASYVGAQVLSIIYYRAVATDKPQRISQLRTTIKSRSHKVNSPAKMNITRERNLIPSTHRLLIVVLRQNTVDLRYIHGCQTWCQKIDFYVKFLFVRAYLSVFIIYRNENTFRNMFVIIACFSDLYLFKNH